MRSPAPDPYPESCNPSEPTMGNQKTSLPGLARGLGHKQELRVLAAAVPGSAFPVRSPSRWLLHPWGPWLKHFPSLWLSTSPVPALPPSSSTLPPIHKEGNALVWSFWAVRQLPCLSPAFSLLFHQDDETLGSWHRF